MIYKITPLLRKEAAPCSSQPRLAVAPPTTPCIHSCKGVWTSLIHTRSQPSKLLISMPSQILILPPERALPLPSSCLYWYSLVLLPYQKTKIKITIIKVTKHELWWNPQLTTQVALLAFEELRKGGDFCLEEVSREGFTEEVAFELGLSNFTRQRIRFDAC